MFEHIPSALAEQNRDNGSNDSNNQVDHLLSILLRILSCIMRQRDLRVSESDEEERHSCAEKNCNQVRKAMPKRDPEQGFLAL